MAKGASNKGVKFTTDRISSAISSGIIVDQYDFTKRDLVSRVKNHVRNSLVLNQTETSFLDFKRKNFPDQSKELYDQFYTAYKRKDKVELMKRLSVPLYDIVKGALKETNPLPFTIYRNLLEAELMQARIYSMHKHRLNPNQSWHQVTMKFVFEDPEGKEEVIKYPVFERRESEPSVNDWRICYFE